MANSSDTLNFPVILEPYQTSARHFTRGGGSDTLNIVSCPPAQIGEGEESTKVFEAWLEWWKKTAWATANPRIHPRWNSQFRTGQIWKQFGEAVSQQNGHPYVFCFNCGSALQHPAAQVKPIGTKHLLNHSITTTCTKTQTPSHPRSSTTIHSSPSQNKTPTQTPSYSRLAFERELLRVVIDGNWPFRTIERPAFRRFVQFLRPESVITTRYKFQAIFDEHYEVAKASILHDLGTTTKISIALDAWSANNHLSFLAIKGYYINSDWKLCEKLLDFVPIRGSHTGASMASEVLQVLLNTKTQRRLLAITADNASNNTTLAYNLEAKLEELHIYWDSKENTIPCLAHIINLVVQDIIRHLKLATSNEQEEGLENIPEIHIEEIENGVSVPNSLRKVCWHYHSLLSHAKLRVAPSYLYSN